MWIRYDKSSVKGGDVLGLKKWIWSIWVFDWNWLWDGLRTDGEEVGWEDLGDLLLLMR